MKLPLTAWLLAGVLFATGCSFLPTPRQEVPLFTGPDDNPSLWGLFKRGNLELSYARLSLWCAAAAVLAFVTKHTSAAISFVCAAIALPVLGRFIDLLLGLTAFFVFISIAVGLIAGWYLLLYRNRVTDDEPDLI